MNIIIMECIGGKYGNQLTENCLELHQDDNHYNNLTQGCLIYGIVHTLLGVAIASPNPLCWAAVQKYL